MHPVGQITQLLAEVRQGSESATDEVFALTCNELRRIAEGAMRSQSSGHILQATALVNEAVARILNSEGLRRTENRRMFFGLAARAMRCVLVDYARQRAARRRNGQAFSASPVVENFVERFEEETQVKLLILDEALDTLKVNNSRQHEVVVMRFFGGFKFKEIASHLKVSVSTVEKDWTFARAWLRRALG